MERRRKSPFVPSRLQTVLVPRYDADLAARAVSHRGHVEQHEADVLMYTSTTTLTTGTSTPFFPQFRGRIIKVQASVVTAPSSSDLTLVLLIKGVTAATVTIPQGSTSGFCAVPDIPHFSVDNADYLQWQVTTTGGAGGPLVAQALLDRIG